MKFKNGLNIGINFIDAKRKRHTSIQYVKNGVAIADIFFYNGQIQRCLIAPNLSNSFKTHFVNAAKALASRNPPQDFAKTSQSHRPTIPLNKNKKDYKNVNNCSHR